MLIGPRENEDKIYISDKLVDMTTHGKVIIRGFSDYSDEVDEDFYWKESDVYYEIYDLNIQKMLNEKNNIFHFCMHYNTLSKNCSTVVARILKAGGADRMLDPINRIGYAHNFYWTPKYVAQLCNKLRDRNMARKVKNAIFPSKHRNILRTLAGFR
ncbi:hypothetical protein [Xenorhabdus hominickii]|uniref:RTX toxin n=1 Tax=Xenorhabdus hominickii TaxID=351679 RepID=A0A2G0Q8X3_XENHO|nr:hypothetical protein [Xenorhabdus hominickii]AOM41102.1 hypothetical protein A9255_11245 [Xenorhabdus hominickii]PHM55661.1 RTX toxin [Xenorhabdus hominickii]